MRGNGEGWVWGLPEVSEELVEVTKSIFSALVRRRRKLKTIFILFQKNV